MFIYNNFSRNIFFLNYRLYIFKNTESTTNVKYGSKPGFRGPAPKFLGTAVVISEYKNSKIACVSGYISLRLSTSSISDLIPFIATIK